MTDIPESDLVAEIVSRSLAGKLSRPALDVLVALFSAPTDDESPDDDIGEMCASDDPCSCDYHAGRPAPKLETPSADTMAEVGGEFQRVPKAAPADATGFSSVPPGVEEDVRLVPREPPAPHSKSEAKRVEALKRLGPRRRLQCAARYCDNKQRLDDPDGLCGSCRAAVAAGQKLEMKARP